MGVVTMQREFLIAKLKPSKKEILFGRLVNGGVATVDVDKNNNEIQINYESKLKLYYRQNLLQRFVLQN